ncbi:MAG: glutamate--tRNA ligase, partial [Candidatus Thermoplasmatota archaeon]|nr:glutamate--tRNA ligase [Candidatus Thermoplasmatota archaeon]
GAVIGRIMAYDDAFRDDPKTVAQTAGRIVGQVNSMELADQEAKLEELGAIEMEAKDQRREGLPELPGYEEGQQVVMRFAPNPNGPPTLGHSRGMCVNGWYAKEYDGELILRFDDTDPVNKAPWAPAYDMFEEAFAWLGIDIQRVERASDRLEIYYEHAEQVLEQGDAYVCTCEADTFRDLKNAGEACEHRDLPPEDNLAAWQGMLDGDLGPGEAVVRIKTDITHKDPALRDWVAMRIVEIDAHPHARTGTDFHVWPMLDFESAIEDHLLGVTHIIRGKDLADSERKQQFLYDHLGWTYPEVLHWGRVAVHGFGKFSTSGLRRDIEAGKYTGWDDPQLPTLAALKRRGFRPEAIMAFWVSLGLTEKDISASLETLEAENRKRIDAEADRLFFVPDPVTCSIQGLEAPLEVHLPRHPTEDRGERTVTVDGEVLVPTAALEGMETGTVFRLKDGLDVRYDGGASLTFVSAEPSEERDGPIVQWCPSPGVACQVLTPEGTRVEGRVEEGIRG